MTEVNDQSIKNGTLKPIPMGYLRKGDRFVAIKPGTVSRSHKIMAGVAHMDGHWVSENYGFRPGFTESYLGSADEYINVHLDGVDYSNWTRDDRQRNTGLYRKDNWEFFVTLDIWNRYAQDVARNQAISVERAEAANAEASRLADEALERIKERKARTKARLQDDLASLKRQVENIQTTIAGME